MLDMPSKPTCPVLLTQYRALGKVIRSTKLSCLAEEQDPKKSSLLQMLPGKHGIGLGNGAV